MVPERICHEFIIVGWNPTPTFIKLMRTNDTYGNNISNYDQILHRNGRYGNEVSANNIHDAAHTAILIKAVLCYTPIAILYPGLFTPIIFQFKGQSYIGCLLSYLLFTFEIKEYTILIEICLYMSHRRIYANENSSSM